MHPHWQRWICSAELIGGAFTGFMLDMNAQLAAMPPPFIAHANMPPQNPIQSLSVQIIVAPCESKNAVFIAQLHHNFLRSLLVRIFRSRAKPICMTIAAVEAVFPLGKPSAQLKFFTQISTLPSLLFFVSA